MKLPEASEHLPASGQASTTTPGITPLGLHPSLLPIADWAHENGVLDSLLLVVDISGHHKLVGTVLHYISEQIPNDLLKLWAVEHPALPGLTKLAVAFASSEPVKKLCHRAPRDIPLRAQMQDGELTRYVVAALVTRQVNFSVNDSVIWLEKVRLWCVVQFVSCAQAGIHPSRRLVDIATKIRQAIDDKPIKVVWKDVFDELRTAARTLYQVHSDLLRRAGEIAEELSGESDTEKVDGKRQFFERLHRYEDGSDSRDEPSNIPISRYFIQYFSPKKPDSAWVPAYTDWFDPDEVDDLPPTLTQETHEDSGTSLSFDLQGHETGAEETKLSKSVILLSMEDQQHLPLSWNRPNYNERLRLSEWLSLPAPNEEAIATWILIAALAHQSPTNALRLPLDSTPSDEWKLNPETLQLHRTRHKHRGSVPPSTASHVAPWTDIATYTLPMWAQGFLSRGILTNPSASNFSGLFNGETPKTLEARLRQQMANVEGLSRITPAAISQWLGQEVFEHSLDPVLTHLITSQKRSGLPGACAYASFRRSDVNKSQYPRQGIPNIEFSPPQTQDTQNVLGSYLDVDDAWLSICFEDALGRVNALAPVSNAWIEHHNALVSYLVGVLLAATGARPISSPFESPKDFDFQRCVVFVDDKTLSIMHAGRILPLPSLASELIQEIYLTHLAHLAGITSEAYPFISDAIAKLSRCEDPGNLPFFFFIQMQEGRLRHVEVGPSSMKNLGVLDFNLPFNVLRHRFSTGLKRLGADHEVVNGLMGHIENGTSTWGPHSMRCWSDDMVMVRQIVEQLLEPLKIGRPLVGVSSALPRSQDSPSGLKPVLNEAIFGRKARESRRTLALDRAIQQAQQDIERLHQELLKSNPKLTRKDMDWIADQLRIQKNGLPHPWESLRYEQFLEWRDKHPELPPPMKRYLPRNQEPSPFTQSSVQAAQKMEQLDAWLKGPALEDPKHAKQRRLSLLAGLAHLIIESRVTNKRLVADLLSNRNYRITKLQDTFYLEYGRNLDKQPGSPVFRYKISRLAAFRLASARESNYELTSMGSMESAYQSLADALGLHQAQNYADLFKHVAGIVEQMNWQELPGTYAAYLAGTVISVGLHHHDWIRLHVGTAKDLPEVDARDDASRRGDIEFPEDHETFDPNASPEDLPYDENFLLSFDTKFLTQAGSGQSPALATPPTKRLQRSKSAKTTTSDAVAISDSTELEPLEEAKLRAQTLMKEVHECLKSAKLKRAGIRKHLNSELQKVIRRNALASTACLLFAEWVRSLLYRRTRRGRLKVVSIERYFQPLAPCFEQLAYAIDLRNCDSEELTTLYAEMMEARKKPNREIRSQAAQARQDTESASPDTDAPVSTPYKSWQLAYWTLKEFHRFSQKHVALEEPDWSEIDSEDVTMGVSAHLILEAEYLHALRSLASEIQTTEFHTLQKCFVLLLTYRFGLRGAEAINLLRADWVQIEDSKLPLIVLVRGNRHHRLKTFASRRQVPLIFELTEYEQKLIERYLVLWRGETGDSDTYSPLFPGLEGKENESRGQALRQELTLLLKETTQNKYVSLHTARHTFGSLAMLLLQDDGLHLLSQLLVSAPQTQWIHHVRATLLSTTMPTRRSLWAVARLLGHSHPRMSLRSYIHLLPELCYRRIESNHHILGGRKLSSIRLDQVFDLDALSVSSAYLKQLVAPKAPCSKPLSANDCLKVFRLLSKGVSDDRIHSYCDIEMSVVQTIRSMLNDVDLILAKYPEANPSKGSGSILLDHVGTSRLNWWINNATLVEPIGSFRPTYEDLKQLAIPSLIGPSRHVLLHDKVHFDFFSELLSKWEIQASQLRFIAAPKLSPIVRSWAEDKGFQLINMEDIVVEARPLNPKVSARKALENQQKKRYFKIDPVVKGEPPVQVLHRCAVLFNPNSLGQLTSSYELVLLVLIRLCIAHSIFQIAQSSSLN